MPLRGFSRVACVENKSSHPLAPALVNYARLFGIEPTGDVTDFEIIPGEGVSALVDGQKVKIGNARLAAQFSGFQGEFMFPNQVLPGNSYV